MPELEALKTGVAELLVASSGSSWAGFASTAVVTVLALVVYLKTSKLYKKVIVDENTDHAQGALVKNPLDNATDSSALESAEKAVEDELKGGT